MGDSKRFSILFPEKSEAEVKRLSDTTYHDLGIDAVLNSVTDDAKERQMISDVLSNMTSDPDVSSYRQAIFADLIDNPKLRDELKDLFEKIEFLKSFNTIHKTSDEEIGIWHLFQRLDEIDSYIKCVEGLKSSLSDERIRSQGLQGLKRYIDDLYDEAFFEQMKKDIKELKVKASDVKSVTVGINVNDRLEAVSMGLVSVNKRSFKKSGIVSSFSDAIATKDSINEDTEWDGDMHYKEVDKDNKNDLAAALERSAGISTIAFVDSKIKSTLAGVSDGDSTKTSTFYLENVLNKMLGSMVKTLRDTLTKYANIAIVNISQLVPEFIYYIRFAEFIDNQRAKGFAFCEASVTGRDGISMDAKGFYNIRLALTLPSMNDIVTNDLIFDDTRLIYILTGANRGGKTTITQAVGLLYVLAQGGIYVPASSFEYKPVDQIYTHFPADEDKTTDLGRLGEECVRFKEIYQACTDRSLILLNESFSTTSFEEGYYIAKDCIKALMRRRVRTIYNTHMHKLASDSDMEELNGSDTGHVAASLVMMSDSGKRSFKVVEAPPEGLSYARDIAEKYGVTYELLTE
ncbi:MAG: DNA mismatch repair protein [Clostridiales bacterium]|nr:DNA mismatch repair protein [Clostridiales bacterium]